MTEQWGDPIVVNGVRPAWLRDGENILLLWDDGLGWYCWEGGASANRVFDWPRVTKIRLPADHWAYPVIAKGFTPWVGGDHAPDDWDGRTVLLGNGNIIEASMSFIWHKHHPYDDIIGYKRKEAQMDAIPEWAYDRMKELYVEKDGMAASFARYIAKHEDAPIDPDMIAAREIVARCAGWFGHNGHTDAIHAGMWDDAEAGLVQASLAAIKRGRAMERGE